MKTFSELTVGDKIYCYSFFKYSFWEAEIIKISQESSYLDFKYKILNSIGEIIELPFYTMSMLAKNAQYRTTFEDADIHYYISFLDAYSDYEKFRNKKNRLIKKRIQPLKEKIEELEKDKDTLTKNHKELKQLSKKILSEQLAKAKNIPYLCSEENKS